MDILLPDDSPERYRAVVRAAGRCTVEKHLQQPPEIRIAARALTSRAGDRWPRPPLRTQRVARGTGAVRS